MGEIPPSLLVHTITIEPYAGTTGAGVKVYGTAYALAVFFDDKRRMVRDSTGSQILSEGTAYGSLDASVPPESRATLPDGRTATVMAALRRDGGGLPTPDHLEIIFI
jgi:hypothetical protein